MSTEKKKEKVEKTSKKMSSDKVQPTESHTKADSLNALQKRRTVDGIVTSNKMQKTIVVQVSKRVKHDLYKKYVTKKCKYKAHDDNNDAKVGDLVKLVESRPLSRDKRWALKTIIRRANDSAALNV